MEQSVSDSGIVPERETAAPGATGDGGLGFKRVEPAIGRWSQSAAAVVADDAHDLHNRRYFGWIIRRRDATGGEANQPANQDDEAAREHRVQRPRL